MFVIWDVNCRWYFSVNSRKMIPFSDTRVSKGESFFGRTAHLLFTGFAGGILFRVPKAGSLLTERWSIWKARFTSGKLSDLPPTRTRRTPPPRRTPSYEYIIFKFPPSGILNDEASRRRKNEQEFINLWSNKICMPWSNSPRGPG